MVYYMPKPVYLSIYIYVCVIYRPPIQLSIKEQVHPVEDLTLTVDGLNWVQM